ncbi:MAG: hypothetical protein ACXWFQ_10695, partial [Thermoanaerobaculia bacterium]
ETGHRRLTPVQETSAVTDFFFRGLLLEARVLGDELDAAYASCKPVGVNSVIHLHERTRVEKDPSATVS